MEIASVKNIEKNNSKWLAKIRLLLFYVYTYNIYFSITSAMALSL